LLLALATLLGVEGTTSSPSVRGVWTEVEVIPSGHQRSAASQVTTTTNGLGDLEPLCPYAKAH
jgi:hypothetical protein